jgi:RNA recognition motif-containing protein
MKHQQEDRYRERIERPHRREVRGSRTVFVGNLHSDVGDEDLLAFMGAVGEVRYIHWVNDPASGAFRGCAFVQYHDAHCCRDAVERLNGRLMLDRPVRLDFARDIEHGHRRDASTKRAQRVYKYVFPSCVCVCAK